MIASNCIAFRSSYCTVVVHLCPIGLVDATKEPELADLYAVLEQELLDDPKFVADRAFFAQFLNYIHLTLCFALRSVTHIPLAPSPAPSPDTEVASPAAAAPTTPEKVLLSSHLKYINTICM